MVNNVKYKRVKEAKREVLIATFDDLKKSYDELSYKLSVVVLYNIGTRIDWYFLPSDVPGMTIF